MVERRVVKEHGSVTSAALPPTPAAAGRWRLPAGNEFDEADFAWRHHIVCAIVAGHLVALVLLALAVGRTPGRALLTVAPGSVLLALCFLPVRRRWCAWAATFALLTCSATLVQLFADHTELYAHVLVAVAVVAFYQDWMIYVVSVLFVTLQHGLLLPEQGWEGAAVYGGLVLAEAVVLVMFWRANEAARAEQEHMRAALQRGESRVRDRLQETDRIRTDLIGTVSHEFRTPLTIIRGTALTLLKRGERMEYSDRAGLLRSVLEQQERLSRLLENMLTAAEATATDPSAAAEVDAVAAEVAMLAGADHPEAPPVSVLVEPGTNARMDRQALHQVLANLVDNAQQHGAVGAVPLVAGGVDERGVWVTVSNEGTTLDSQQARRLFEPFTQADSGPTREREGVGMGLYVVRRLVEVHGGSVALRSEGGWTTVELRLAAAEVAGRPRRMAV